MRATDCAAELCLLDVFARYYSLSHSRCQLFVRQLALVLLFWQFPNIHNVTCALCTSVWQAHNRIHAFQAIPLRFFWARGPSLSESIFKININVDASISVQHIVQSDVATWDFQSDPRDREKVVRLVVTLLHWCSPECNRHARVSRSGDACMLIMTSVIKSRTLNRRAKCNNTQHTMYEIKYSLIWLWIHHLIWLCSPLFTKWTSIHTLLYSKCYCN